MILTKNEDNILMIEFGVDLENRADVAKLLETHKRNKVVYREVYSY